MSLIGGLSKKRALQDSDGFLKRCDPFLPARSCDRLYCCKMDRSATRPSRGRLNGPEAVSPLSRLDTKLGSMDCTELPTIEGSLVKYGPEANISIGYHRLVRASSILPKVGSHPIALITSSEEESSAPRVLSKEALWIKINPAIFGVSVVQGPSLPRESLKLRTPDPVDVALFLHTSGTTSRPKGVPLSHANLLASARTIASWYRLTPEDVRLCGMPLSHVHGLLTPVLSSLVLCLSAIIPQGSALHASGLWSVNTGQAGIRPFLRSIRCSSRGPTKTMPQENPRLSLRDPFR